MNCLNEVKSMIEDLRLIDPTNCLEKEYLHMISEWKQTGEELIPWSLNLDTTNFNLMIKTLNGYREGVNLPDGFLRFSTYRRKNLLLNWMISK